MQTMMTEKIGIYRNQREMSEAVSSLQSLRLQYQELIVADQNHSFNTNLLEIFELGNLLDLAYITAASALNRTESRGAHAREDYSERDDANWLKHTLARLSGNNIQFNYKTVDISLWKPKPRKY